MIVNFETFSKWINNFKSQKDISALVAIFWNISINCICLCETEYIPYQKKTSSVNKSDILLILKKILPRKEFSGTAVQEISEGRNSDVMQILGTKLFNNQSEL
ncbi:hypothetical protein Glove_21g73 [Diversispora epigaea]|uniref:Uncharacterized protein n=1 Tax=Diversispora epigaea TaxID=1348612 RepID=A0A397JWL2_9GLOM|nr:hypothetical protein Glove_21g73 [Diversispora epigaea]